VEIALIAALARNRVIGVGGQLPWHLPDDLAHFKRTTAGSPVLMGRRTFASIGRPLPRRENIVLSRDRGFTAKGCRVAASLEAGLAAAAGAEVLFAIGGQSLFEALLPRADRMHLTWVEADVAGDAFFPEVDFSAWKCTDEVAHPRDDRHRYAFRIASYARIGAARAPAGA
jgi:dihydrofolate reductase